MLLDKSGAFGPEPSSENGRLEFDVPKQTTTLKHTVNVRLTEGHANIRLTDSAGEMRQEFGTGGSMRIPGYTRTWGRTGTWRLELLPEKAVGTWSVRIATSAEAVPVVLYLVPGLGMVAVGVAAVWWWRLKARARWRWFLAGAAVWAVGVALKFGWAIPLNGPILKGIGSLVPHTAYLLLGSVYIGLLTGVFEIGVTLVAALIWKRMTDNAARGIAVGVGAGAFEAVLLGLASLAAMAAALATGGHLRDRMIAETGVAAQTTLLWWLVPSVERAIAIVCHTSSRGLVLWGVARRRWFWPFVAGFTIMTAIDAVAGYVHLAGLLGKVSLWSIELAIAPAAVLSIPLLIWCYHTWPLPGKGDANNVNDQLMNQTETDNRSSDSCRAIRRDKMLAYGIVASIGGLAIGIVLRLPVVWGLAILGTVIGVIKLVWTRPDT